MKLKNVFLSLALLSFLVLPVVSSAVIVGYKDCVSKCENDPHCIKDCRDTYMDPEDADEEYKKEFRECFNKCYDMHGPEKKKCLEGCRKNYKIGNDL